MAKTRRSRGYRLSIPDAMVTALIGPSGCGKSTLLRLILGLILPTSGSVFVGGKPVDASTAQELRRQSGYVIQDGGLFPHLTAEENVTLMARHLGWAVDLGKLAELVRLPVDVLRRYPGELSGGQKQRVGLMRALALSPQLLLLDEPLGALDPLVRSSLQQDLKGIFQSFGQTVVLVTHEHGGSGVSGGSDRAAAGRACCAGRDVRGFSEEPCGAVCDGVFERAASVGGALRRVGGWRLAVSGSERSPHAHGSSPLCVFRG